ncbi:MAG: hypothetical protein ACT4OK_12675 [Gemmobacter sp.]
MPKTGTSLLQNVLHLATSGGPVGGVHYPAFGRGRALAHHILPEALRPGAAKGCDPARLAADLVADLAADPAVGPGIRVALYSSEGFANLCGVKPAPMLGDFLQAVGAAVPVRAVLIVREVTGFLESMYLQSARFGHMAQDFEAYVAPRERWWADFLAGIALLRDRLGDAFEVRLAEPGYDVLTDFADRLALPLDDLRGFAAGVPPTSKLSWKAQVVLANLPAVEAAVGFPMRRQALVKAFQTGLQFRDDITRYSLYPPGARAALAARLAAMATEGGLPDYARVFAAAADPATDRAPHATFAMGALTPRDIARLTRARRRLRDAATRAA